MLKNLERFMTHLFRPRPELRIEHDEVGVSVFRPDGTIEYVRWDALTQVVLITTDEGPFVEDVFWLLVGGPGEDGRPSGAALPGGHVQGALLDRLLALPGFDHERFIGAMGSTANAEFLCWTTPTAA